MDHGFENLSSKSLDINLGLVPLRRRLDGRRRLGASLVGILGETNLGTGFDRPTLRLREVYQLLQLADKARHPLLVSG